MDGMGRAPAALLVLLVLVAGVGGVQAHGPEWTDEVYREVRTLVEAYNARIDGTSLGVVEAALHREFAGRVVELEVAGPDGGVAVYSFRTDERGRVHDLAVGGRPDATLRLLASRATVGRVAGAADPAGAFLDAFWNGAIRVESVGLPGRVLAALLGAVQFVASADPAAVGAAAAGGAAAVYVAVKFGVDGAIAAATRLWAWLERLIATVVEFLQGVLAWMESVTEAFNTLDSFLNLLDRVDLLGWLLSPFAVAYRRVKRAAGNAVRGVRRRLAGARRRVASLVSRGERGG